MNREEVFDDAHSNTTGIVYKISHLHFDQLESQLHRGAIQFVLVLKHDQLQWLEICAEVAVVLIWEYPLD